MERSKPIHLNPAFVLLATVVFFLMTGTVSAEDKPADEVYLADDQKIVGKIIQIEKGKIQVKPGFSDVTLPFDFEKVVNMTTTKSGKIYFGMKDENVVGKVDKIENGKIFITLDIGGTQTINRDTLKKLVPVEEPPKAQVVLRNGDIIMGETTTIEGGRVHIKLGADDPLKEVSQEVSLELGLVSNIITTEEAKIVRDDKTKRETNRRIKSIEDEHLVVVIGQDQEKKDIIERISLKLLGGTRGRLAGLKENCQMRPWKENPTPETITLKNDKIKNDKIIEGKITSIKDKKVTIKQDCEKRVIGLEDIADLQSVRLWHLHLSNGHKLTVNLDSVENDNLGFVPKTVEFQGINENEEIQSINLLTCDCLKKMEPIEALPCKGGKVKKSADGGKKSAQCGSQTGGKKWGGSLEAESKFNDATKDTAEGGITVKANGEIRANGDLALSLKTYYRESEHKMTHNSVEAKAKLRFFWEEDGSFYRFYRLSGTYDEPKSIDLRAELFAGFGKYCLGSKKGGDYLFGEIGAGITGEFVDDEDGEEKQIEEVSGFLKLGFEKKVFEWKDWDPFRCLVATGEVSFIPSFSNFEEFRIDSEGALEFFVNDSTSINIKVTNKYDSNPEGEDADRNDFMIGPSLKYKF